MMDHTVGQILQMHGYRDGTEQQRLLLVFKDLARARAERALFELAIPQYMKPLVERGLAELVDA